MACPYSGIIPNMGRKKLVGPATTHIASQLHAQKERQGWTYDDLEERTGLPRSTIERTLKGDTAISVEVLIPLAAGMDLSAATLLDEAWESLR